MSTATIVSSNVLTLVSAARTMVCLPDCAPSACYQPGWPISSPLSPQGHRFGPGGNTACTCKSYPRHGRWNQPGREQISRTGFAGITVPASLCFARMADGWRFKVDGDSGSIFQFVGIYARHMLPRTTLPSLAFGPRSGSDVLHFHSARTRRYVAVVINRSRDRMGRDLLGTTNSLRSLGCKRKRLASTNPGVTAADDSSVTNKVPVRNHGTAKLY